jgi:orotate phosphoribosyltransferase-like protein
VTGDYVYLVVAYSISHLASILHHGWKLKKDFAIYHLYHPQKTAINGQWGWQSKNIGSVGSEAACVLREIRLALFR